VVVAGYFLYTTYGDQILNAINNGGAFTAPLSMLL
jgi:hypothetical protein